MAELSLTAVFGAGATQTATILTITKADLTGLTASATNNPDSIMVALLNKLTTAYAQSVRDANKDVSLVATLNPIPQVVGDFTVTPNVAYTVYNYSLGVYLPLATTTPNPNLV